MWYKLTFMWGAPQETALPRDCLKKPLGEGAGATKREGSPELNNA